jgi:hypothetical protein
MLARTLILITATGTALAATVLWRVCLTRSALRRLRLVLAALSAYGITTLIYLAVRGSSFHDALNGAALRPLPYVLQGAFIAAFVVLPLGWIVSVIHAGFPRFRDGFVAPAAVQAIALTACVALLFTSMPQRQSVSTVTEMNPQKRLETLDRSLRALEESERQAPRDRWDPDYVVSVLGKDPQRLFAWVRDNTFWIPYRGVLRGPVGVLMDRQGNSLDRAILLATLLEKAGHRVRLARGELTQQKVLELLPTLTARRRVYAGEPSPLNTAAAHIQSVADAAASHPADLSSIEEQNVEEVTAQYQPVADAIGARFSVGQGAVAAANKFDSRVASEAAGLLTALEKPDPIKDWDARFNAAVTALRDHWWVQVQDSQSWSDFDLLSDSGNRTALAVPAAIAALNNVATDLYHEIAIRVVAEQWSGAGFTSRTALEYSLRPAETIGQAIVLQFWPTAWLTDFNSSGLKHTLLEAASQDQWAAMLAVGKKAVAQTLLVATGVRAEGQPKGGDLGGLGSAIADALAGNSKPHELSAVWIEYEIHVPGETAKKIHRTVFDLVGPEARASAKKLLLPLDETKKLTRGLALMMRTEIEPIACAIPTQFVQHAVAQNLLANRHLLTAIAGRDLQLPNPTVDSTTKIAEHPQKQNTAEKLLAAAAPPPSPLLGVAAARLRAGAMANPAFIDRSNILTRHRFFIPAGEQIAALEAIDIAANEVGIDLAAWEAFPIRLWQGVLDTNLEARVDFGAATDNVGEAFATTKGWAMLTPSQRSGLEMLSFPADARRRITDDLDSRYIVVSPETPVQEGGNQFVGWWRINPETGDTLGVSANGWGQSVEWARLMEFASTAAEAFDFEFVLCQFSGQVMNTARILNEKVFGGWHPVWTTATAKSKDPIEVVKENYGGCLIQAMTEGALATLPLLLITLRARGARLAAHEVEEAAEAAAARAKAGGGPCAIAGQPIICCRTVAIPAALVWPLSRSRTTPLTLPYSSAASIAEALLWQGSGNGCPPRIRPLNNTLQSPGVRPPIPSGKGSPHTLDEVKKKMDRAEAAMKAAKEESFKSSQAACRYLQNSPRRDPAFADPSVKWDPNVQKQLFDDMRQKSSIAWKAIEEWEDAKEAYETWSQ